MSNNQNQVTFNLLLVLLLVYHIDINYDFRVMPDRGGHIDVGDVNVAATVLLPWFTVNLKIQHVK